MAEVTISSKNQIVIPAEARKALKVKAGDRILVTVAGDKMLVIQRPDSYSAAIRGLARGKYPADYHKKERDSWD